MTSFLSLIVVGLTAVVTLGWVRERAAIVQQNSYEELAVQFSQFHDDSVELWKCLGHHASAGSSGDEYNVPRLYIRSRDASAWAASDTPSGPLQVYSFSQNNQNYQGQMDTSVLVVTMAVVEDRRGEVSSPLSFQLATTTARIRGGGRNVGAYVPDFRRKTDGASDIVDISGTPSSDYVLALPSAGDDETTDRVNIFSRANYTGADGESYPGYSPSNYVIASPSIPYHYQEVPQKMLNFLFGYEGTSAEVFLTSPRFVAPPDIILGHARTPAPATPPAKTHTTKANRDDNRNGCTFNTNILDNGRSRLALFPLTGTNAGDVNYLTSQCDEVLTELRRLFEEPALPATLTDGDTEHWRKRGFAMPRTGIAVIQEVAQDDSGDTTLCPTS